MKITDAIVEVVAHGFSRSNLSPGELVITTTDGSTIYLEVPEDVLSSLFKVVEDWS